MSSVLIIGAGLSGLYAAKTLSELSQGKIEVTVLEARERVGGRTHTMQTSDGSAATDMGGAYVSGSHKILLKLADELGVQTYEPYGDGKLAVHLQGQQPRFTSMDDITWNPIILLDLSHILWLLNQLSQQVPLKKPWRAEKAAEWDIITFQQFLEKHTWTRTARNVVRALLINYMSCEMYEMSLLGVLYGIRACGGIQEMLGIESQEYKFVGGSQQISEKLAARLGNVVLKQVVTQIVDKPGEKVKVMTAGGKVFQADYVINAMPQNMFGNLLYDPPLSGMKRQYLQRAPCGTTAKVIIFYEKPYWREKGLSGEMLTDYGPCLYCFDDCQPDGSNPALVTFLIGNQMRSLFQLSVQERKAALCQHFARVFKDDNYLHPVNYLETDWTSEQFTGGAYGVYESPGVITQFKEVRTEPHGRIYFTGSDSSPAWTGYMEGALLSGEHTALQILNLLQSKYELCGNEDSMSRTVKEMENNHHKSPMPLGRISIDLLIACSLVLASAILVAYFMKIY